MLVVPQCRGRYSGQQHRAEAGGTTIALEQWNGEAYYIRPGHNAHIDSETELVEFTRADRAPAITTVELAGKAPADLRFQ